MGGCLTIGQLSISISEHCCFMMPIRTLIEFLDNNETSLLSPMRLLVWLDSIDASLANQIIEKHTEKNSNGESNGTEDKATSGTSGSE